MNNNELNAIIIDQKFQVNIRQDWNKFYFSEELKTNGSSGELNLSRMNAIELVGYLSYFRVNVEEQTIVGCNYNS